MFSIDLFFNAAIFLTICKTAYQFQFENFGNGNEENPCEEGWKKHGQYCYVVKKPPLSWERASSGCSSLGAHLASVHSKEEHDFLCQFTVHEHLWIGMHDRAIDGIHEWEDGSEVDFTKWAPGEPSGEYHATKEDCVQMCYTHTRGVRGDWNDENCNNRRGYICRKEARILDITTMKNSMDNKSTGTLSIATTNTMMDNESTRLADTTIKSNMMDNKSIQVVNSTTTSIMKDKDPVTISVTTFIWSLLLAVLLCAYVGGLIYYKRHWLKEQRVKMATAISRSSASIRKRSNEWTKENCNLDENRSDTRIHNYEHL